MPIPQHHIERYSGKSTLKGVPVIKPKNYFLLKGFTVIGDAPKVLIRIYENEFYLSKKEIKALFLRCDTAKMFRTIDSEFSKMLSPERIQMIKLCLEHRYNEIMSIIE